MLSDMLQYAAEATGVRDVNSATRAQLLRYINRAGRELYEKYDLPGTVLEVTACVDPTEGQITLPWYVDQIRAARRAEIHQPITLQFYTPLLPDLSHNSKPSRSNVDPPCNCLLRHRPVPGAR